MKLYSYWRSTTSFRVRAALNLKGIRYNIVPVDLMSGEQKAPDYAALNPSSGVPTLVLDDGTALTQLLVIMDYLDATWPAPRLLPDDPLKRARVLAAAHTVAMDIHPVNNLRVVRQLQQRFGANPEQEKEWMVHWMTTGFTALQAQLNETTTFAFGETPDMADLCIAAQVYSARRWKMDMTPFPILTRIESTCLSVPEIMAAHPDNQPVAEVPT